MNLPTIEKLRQDGYRIRVTHKRYAEFSDGNDIVISGPMHKSDFTVFERVYPKGGETTVEITTPDGNELWGTSQCSLKDVFNRKLGLKIALGRALRGSDG